MSYLTLIQIALGLIKLANWFTVQVSQKQWKSSGYQEAMQDGLSQINKHVASIDQIKSDVIKKTDSELDEELGS